MRKKYVIYGAIVTVLLVMAGCAKEQPTDPKEGGDTGNGRPIEIRAFLKEGDKITPMSELVGTRALPNTLENGFYLYGMAGTTKWTGNYPSGSYIWDAVKANKYGTVEGGTKMWLSDGATYHHFGAAFYLPTGLVDLKDNDTYVGWKNTTLSNGNLEFTQYVVPTEQLDPLVAEPVTNLTASSSAPVVNLYFKHAFARIIIKLYGSGSTPLYNVNSTVQYVSSIYKRIGLCVLNTGVQSGAASAYMKTGVNYQLSTTSFNISAANKDREHAVYVGDLILPPISTNYPVGWVLLKFTYSFSPGGTTETVTAALPGTTEGLLAGMQYTYYINYIVNTSNLTVEDVNVSNWVTEERLVDDLN